MSEILAREQRVAAGLALAEQANDAFDRGDSRIFESFVAAGGELIGRNTRDSGVLFSSRAGMAALKHLPAPYRELAETRHEEMAGQAERAIHEGSLPERYRLPPLSFFGERLQRIAPGFGVIDREGWSPELVFVPKGLGLDQWHDLLEGHAVVQDDAPPAVVSSGLLWPWPASCLRRATSFTPWDVAAINAGETAAISPVTGEDIQGSDADRVRAVLAPLATGQTVDEVVRAASPSVDTYLALQWLHLEWGDQPLDRQVATLLRESINFFGEEPSFILTGTWLTEHSAIELGASDIDEIDSWRAFGIRPTVEGNDLLAT